MYYWQILRVVCSFILASLSVSADKLLVYITVLKHRFNELHLPTLKLKWAIGKIEKNLDISDSCFKKLEYTIYYVWHVFLSSLLQWNLSIADMLYIGHLSITDSIFWNQLPTFHWNILLYSGHLSIADTFLENQCCPL